MNPQLGQRLFSIPDPNAIGLTANETVDAMYSLTADPEQEALMMETLAHLGIQGKAGTAA